MKNGKTPFGFLPAPPGPVHRSLAKALAVHLVADAVVPFVLSVMKID